MSNKNISNSNMNLQEILKLPGKKPKPFNKLGNFSQSFLKWNRKQIKEGKTDKYAIPGIFYNSNTGRLIKGRYNKAGTSLLKSFTKKYPNIKGSVIQDYYVDERYIPENLDFETFLYNGEDINTASFLYNKLKRFKVGDFVRLILTTDDIKNSTVSVRDDTDDNFTYINVPLEEKIKNRSGFNADKNIIMNTTFKVPEENTFDLQLVLFYNSDYRNIISYLLTEDISSRFIITKQIEMTEDQIVQSFAEGVEHCLLNPILLWSKQMANDPKTKDKKKYNSIVNKIVGKTLKTGTKEGYYSKFKAGIPEYEIENLVEDLRLKIVIEYPFKKEKFKEWCSSRKPLKVFSYVNTRYNHVEQLTTTNYKDMVNDEMNQDEMNIKFNELKNNDVYFIFGRTKFGISWIQTHDSIYKLDSEYTRASNKFMKDNHFSNFAIDAVKQKDLTRFVDNGTHFNGTTDFKYLDNTVLNKDSNIRHIDIKKAYSQFKQSKYYKGFVGSITDLREVDNYEQPGLYYIVDLDLEGANEDFVYYNNHMNWFINKNIYTDAELRFLKEMKASFKVKYGAYGIRTDFKFDNDMLNSKESFGLVKKPKRWNGYLNEYEKGEDIDLKISYYAKFIGKCASINYQKKFHMFGSCHYFKAMSDDSNKIYYDYNEKEASIMYDKKSVLHHKHIASQVIAYQRLNIMEQLLKMNKDKVLRVCVDGIYYEDHAFEIDNIYQDKTQEMTFSNQPCTDYLSNIFKQDRCSIKGIKFGRKRTFYKNEAVIGGGGNGKSTREFLDYGNCNVLYVAPSWKLATNVAKKIMTCNDGQYQFPFNPNIDVCVYHRYLYMNFEYKYQDKYNVILCDEASQLTEHTKKHLFSIPNKKNIFLGDIGYQLEPVIDYKELKKNHPKETDFIEWLNAEGHYEMNLKGFDNVLELTKDYRATCDQLKKVKSKLRSFIDKGRYAKQDIKLKIRQQAVDYIKSIIPRGNVEELYRVNDMILTSTHDSIKKYNKMFSHMNKYLVKSNTKEYKNGEIVFQKPEGVKVAKYKDEDVEVTHAYTVHAIQGETLGNDDRLFIDTDNLFSDRHLYTAVSRARRLDQIFLV